MTKVTDIYDDTIYIAKLKTLHSTSERGTQEIRDKSSFSFLTTFYMGDWEVLIL